jgi:hypothetical protein
LNSGKTNMRLGKIPLVIGMPIIVSQNFDVEGGIVNGSTGILKKVRYSLNDDNQLVLRSCIVEISQSSDEALPNLRPHEIPIIEDSVELRFCQDCTLGLSDPKGFGLSSYAMPLSRVLPVFQGYRDNVSGGPDI